VIRVYASLSACLTVVTFAAAGLYAQPPHTAPASQPTAIAAAVPPTVQRTLDRVGCHRPAIASPQTITRGHFVRASQDDWAALCVAGGSSFIYVVWGGTVQCPSTLATQRPKEVQTTGVARTLGTKPPDAIVKALEASGESRNVKLDHDGIEDTVAGAAPSIHYCLNRSWVSF
jgi:hypothetical protein